MWVSVDSSIDMKTPLTTPAKSTIATKLGIPHSIFAHRVCHQPHGTNLVKSILCALTVVLFLNGSATAAELQSCNVTVDVHEDAKGANVRDAPGGKVIAVLHTSRDPLADDWIEAHIIGQSGDWFLIDKATLIGESQKAIFTGSGYIHRSVLEASGLVHTEPIWADHDIRHPQIFQSEDIDQPVDLLACWHDFIKIRIKHGTGWTKRVCTNQRTTCS
jgi:hypothetical protein